MWILAGPIVAAWMGPHFDGSVIVMRFLLARVLLGVTTSSCSAILRGAGQHRLLAITNPIAAVTNLLLSIALVKPLGLSGVALGTLVPLTIAAAFVVIPRACARVGVSVWTMWWHAVWPAAWPAAGLAAVIWVGRPFAGPTLPGLAALLVVAGLVTRRSSSPWPSHPGNASCTGPNWGNSPVAAGGRRPRPSQENEVQSCVRSFSLPDAAHA